MDNLLKNALLVVALLSPFSMAIAEPMPIPPILGIEMTYQEYALQQVSEEHHEALLALLNAESGWDPEAQNPVSTAFGIGQFLDSTWETVGCVKTSDPQKQIDCTLLYIEKNYGNATEAWRMWRYRLNNQGHGWY